jgi:predicted TIM-barrel fold metal-dependent hydrolase
MQRPARAVTEDTRGGETAERTVAIPSGAWDCHTHVFGPPERFPAAAAGAYALPDADRRRHAAKLAGMGFAHALLIQPTPYGTDHAALFDALAHAGGQLRGIASCGPATSAADLLELRARHIAGLRFVAMPGPDGGDYPGSQGLETWHRLREAMAEAGLHAQLWADGDTCASVAEACAASGRPLVLDHLAGLDPDDRPGTARFDRLADALASGSIWVKLTWFRRSRLPGDYSDMAETVAALAERAPKRVLWGSDWPFVRVATPPDPARLLEHLHAWLGAEAFAQCLCTNPATLLGLAPLDGVSNPS